MEKAIIPEIDSCRSALEPSSASNALYGHSSAAGSSSTERTIDLTLGSQPSASGAILDASVLEVCVRPHEDLRAVLKTIQRTIHCIALVIDEHGRVQGTITDGDFRRAVLKN